MTAHKTLVAVVTPELSITQVGLDMRLDVFFASKFLITTFVFADPFIIDRIWTFDELGYIVQGDICLLD